MRSRAEEVNRTEPSLEYTQVASAGHRFGTPLDLQLAEDSLVVPLHGFQGQDQPISDFLIGESDGNELEHFALSPAQRLDERLKGCG
jgi:hypothetical protein